MSSPGCTSSRSEPHASNETIFSTPMILSAQMFAFSSTNGAATV
jgi:hypothetical protein